MKVSADIDDEDLVEFLDDVDNKAATLREALRFYRRQQMGVMDDRLSDDEQIAYQFLRDQVGVGGMMKMERVKPLVAQEISLDAEKVVKNSVVPKLDRLGYVDVWQQIESVLVIVRSPESDESPPEDDEESSASKEDVEEVGERMDALTEAGKEVSQSAD